MKAVHHDEGEEGSCSLEVGLKRYFFEGEARRLDGGQNFQ
jgi:hypothetical protein